MLMTFDFFILVVVAVALGVYIGNNFRKSIAFFLGFTITGMFLCFLWAICFGPQEIREQARRLVIVFTLIVLTIHVVVEIKKKGVREGLRYVWSELTGGISIKDTLNRMKIGIIAIIFTSFIAVFIFGLINN